MAEEHEVVAEDDWNYIAVTNATGLAKDEAVCVLEIGDSDACPDDENPLLLPLQWEAALAMTERLLTFLAEYSRRYPELTALWPIELTSCEPARGAHTGPPAKAALPNSHSDCRRIIGQTERSVCANKRKGR